MNSLSWPDVASHFIFTTSYSSTCCNCEHLLETETAQMYLEIPVPTDESMLNTIIEEYFNTSDLLGRICEEGCKKFTQAERRNQLTSTRDTEFLIIILTRAIEENYRKTLNKDKVTSTSDIFIR